MALLEEVQEGEDQILNGGCVYDLISRDLMLLENQLPFFVERYWPPCSWTRLCVEFGDERACYNKGKDTPRYTIRIKNSSSSKQQNHQVCAFGPIRSHLQHSCCYKQKLRKGLWSLEEDEKLIRESIVTSGRIRFYFGDKTGTSLTIVCISCLNTKLIIASLSQSFPVRLPNIYSTSLKLPIAIGRTCHLRTNDNDDDKGKDIPRYTIRAKDFSAYKSILVLDMTAAAAQPSYKQKRYQNLLASVGDQEVTRFSDINSFRSCSVKTLKCLRHLPLFSYSNTRGNEIPKQAGVGKFKDLKKNDFNCCAVHASRNVKGRSHLNANAALQVKKEYVLLPAATLLAIVMFTAACRFPRFITKANYIYNYDTGRIVQEERDLTITSSFILFNSTGFIVSLAIVISILRGFPLKPWPQISVTMLFGSYMCLIMKILPLESWLVLFLSVPLLLFAAAGKLCDFAQ